MKKIFKINGMSCSSCARNIEVLMKEKIKDAKDIKINFTTSTLYIETLASDQKIQEVLSLAGNYKIVDEREDIEEKEFKKASLKMWIAAVFSGIIMFLMILMMTDVYVASNYFFITLALAFPVIFVAGWDTHKSALESLKRLKPNMDTLVTLGSLLPFFLSFLRFWYPTMTTFVEMASAILALHLVGRFLEAKARGKTSQAIKKLLEMEAKKATVLINGEEREVNIDDLKIGDVMLVRPGGKIPTDGVVSEGSSYIDEAMVTGESTPIKKIKGDRVIGSTINQQGSLLVIVERVGKDTFLSQIISLVKECQGSKVPIQEFADRVTGYFVPFVLLIALGSFLSWITFPEFHTEILNFFNFPWTNATLPPLTLAILSMTAVLVISCPCALGLATPTALMVGSGMGAERGILIRRGEAIQTMKDVKIILFDKTGTLTKGKPEVTDIVSLDKYSRKDILKYSAAVESVSEHPLGNAIVEDAKKRKIEIKKVTDFHSVTGKGVKGKVEDKNVILGNKKIMEENDIGYREHILRQESLEKEGKTAIFVAVDKRVIGIIAIADNLKENSKEVIEKIKKMGIKTVMITGDNERTANAIAEKAKIDLVVSNVLPEGKVKEVRKMQEKYGVVAMIGDGINDAPALKQANVGIAIGTGTDIAIEAADITLISGKLEGVISAIKLSNHTFKKIKENYFWAWIYNGIAIPVAFFGLLHPIIGAFAMALSSINVILNSLRLKKIKL
jgi:P-type Cu+ transporter